MVYHHDMTELTYMREVGDSPKRLDGTVNVFDDCWYFHGGQCPLRNGELGRSLFFWASSGLRCRS
jgi:hypothetical protein